MIDPSTLALGLVSLAFVVDLATGVRQARSRGTGTAGAPRHPWHRTAGIGLLAAATLLLRAAHRADPAGIAGIVTLMAGCLLLIRGTLAMPRRSSSAT